MATESSMGFKDKEKAMDTLQHLEGRDPEYQKLAIKGLIGRAKRTLQVTKAEEKLTSIKEAVGIFENFLKDFEKLNLPNWRYLPLETVEVFQPFKTHLKINNELYDKFLEVYKSCDGDYKKIRSVIREEDKATWDIIRNKHLKELLKKIEDENLDLWDKDELPTKAHTEIILWAYSPDASKIKKQLSNLEKSFEKYKTQDKKEEKFDKKQKRKHDDSSDESESSEDEESPIKKSK